MEMWKSSWIFFYLSFTHRAKMQSWITKDNEKKALGKTKTVKSNRREKNDGNELAKHEVLNYQKRKSQVLTLFSIFCINLPTSNSKQQLFSICFLASFDKTSYCITLLFFFFCFLDIVFGFGCSFEIKRAQTLFD